MNKMNLKITTLICFFSLLSQLTLAGLKEDMQEIASDITLAMEGFAHHSPNRFLTASNLVAKTTCTHKPVTFFGVMVNDQAQLPFADLKEALRIHMNLPTKKMVQLVGDSKEFSDQGTAAALAFVIPFFDGNHMLEYGYTGHLTESRKELDVNSLLNAYIEDLPAQAYRVLANIVGHSITALTKWGCVASSKVQNYFVVYNEHGADQDSGENCFTKFGDDIMLSDNLLNAADGDFLVMVEGGMQSFNQAVNVLKNDVPVKALLGARTPERRRFFSATEFFYRLQKIDGEIKKDCTSTVLEEYLVELEGWDPQKQDADTKQKLRDQAKAIFIHGDVYKKVKELVDITVVDGYSPYQKPTS